MKQPVVRLLWMILPSRYIKELVSYGKDATLNAFQLLVATVDEKLFRLHPSRNPISAALKCRDI